VLADPELTLVAVRTSRERPPPRQRTAASMNEQQRPPRAPRCSFRRQAAVPAAHHAAAQHPAGPCRTSPGATYANRPLWPPLCAPRLRREPSPAICEDRDLVATSAALGGAVVGALPTSAFTRFHSERSAPSRLKAEGSARCAVERERVRRAWPTCSDLVRTRARGVPGAVFQEPGPGRQTGDRAGVDFLQTVCNR
jgi:hypothetical protein